MQGRRHQARHHGGQSFFYMAFACCVNVWWVCTLVRRTLTLTHTITGYLVSGNVVRVRLLICATRQKLCRKRVYPPWVCPRGVLGYYNQTMNSWTQTRKQLRGIHYIDMSIAVIIVLLRNAIMCCSRLQRNFMCNLLILLLYRCIVYAHCKRPFGLCVAVQ